MDTNNPTPPNDVTESTQAPVCAGCETPLTAITGRTPLCADCRNHFIRYPIPRWIWLFGGAVLLLLVFGLFRLPSGLAAAIHQKRGEHAMAEHRFVTAQHELEVAVRMQPHYQEASLRLLIAAYHNEDLQTAYKCSQRLEGKEIKDEELLTEATTIVSRLNDGIPSDSLQAFFAQRTEAPDEIPEASWATYLANHPQELFADFARAASAVNRKEYPLAERLLHGVLGMDPDYSRGLQLLVTAKREQLQFDSAFYYADRLLALNRELPASYGSKARVLLKQKKDNAAFQLVQEGLRYDARDPYCLATLALVHHFRGDFRNRDALMRRAATDSTLQPQFSHVSEIVSGKETFRN
ncbi:hypothetical protein EPD60_14800 [Flaviaesturariibacter flavus]|uniref:Uncharacterized protein n=1 Tax=Flaviaesturariibacter flavus TaxID=2502780 RepID=A0A4R1B7K4_9BACT|nr:hypothetical protein [Flaviaesturariibacter flavus]TCJ12538.1 hypothetical protein EPD60_14800 [Flaviaesturariibacter flavus]